MGDKRFNLQCSATEAEKNLSQVLQAMELIYSQTKKFAGLNHDEAAKVALCAFTPIVDRLAEDMLKGGERFEKVYAEYWCARAFFLGMAKKTAEGATFLEKARAKRRGGTWEERCQDFYRHGVV